MPEKINPNVIYEVERLLEHGAVTQKQLKIMAERCGISQRSLEMVLSLLRHGDMDLIKKAKSGEIGATSAYQIMKGAHRDRKKKDSKTPDTTSLTIQKARLMLDIELLERQKQELESRVSQQPKGFWHKLFRR